MSAVPSILSDLLIETAPWVLAWRGCSEVLRLVSPCLFSTFSTLNDSEKAYWISSTVSTLHAAGIVPLAVSALLGTPSMQADMLATSSLSVFTLKLFLSYIISDSLGSLYWNKAWAGWQANLIHHSIALLCYSHMILGGYGHFLGLMGVACEATTPFINQRWFLDKAGMKSGKGYFYNGLVMTLLWFIFRVLGFTYLGYRVYLTHGQLQTLLQRINVIGSFLGGYALQLFWFYKIVKGAVKAMQKGKKGKQAAGEGGSMTKRD